MPTLTIDGQEIAVEAGTTIVQAAKRLGITIPVFCYHPGLSRPANCRMCLIEVEKWPKLVPGCYTDAGDGMVVSTTSDKVKETQRSVLEFILLNHPVDCPICDQAGECVLQEHYASYSLQPSRLFHRKVSKNKALPLGPRVMLDAERCILCTRCVRFCEEIPKSPDLIVEDRANTAEITTFPGRQLDNPYSLNVVDICPVGALTDRRFRFQKRVWFLDKHDSICAGCSRGCALRLDSADGRIERVVPRYNPSVNSYWLCDDGRDWMIERNRLAPAAARTGDDEGVAVADQIAQIANWWADDDGDDAEAPAIALSASVANEDVWAWAQLASAAGSQVFLLDRETGTGDDLLKMADRDCNRAGAQAILRAVVGEFGDAAAFEAAAESLDAVILVDGDVQLGDAGLTAVAELEAAAVLTDVASAASEAAEIVVPVAGFYRREGTVVNGQGYVQRIGRPLRGQAGQQSAAQVAAAVAEALDLDIGLADTSAATLFAAIAAAVPEFAGLKLADVGALGAGFGIEGSRPALAEVADGTPGWEPDNVHPTQERPFAIQRGCV